MDIEEECDALIYFIELFFFFNLIWMAFVLLCKTVFHHKFVKAIPFTKINGKKIVKLFFLLRIECLGAFIYLLTRSSFLKIVYLSVYVL